MHGEKNWAVVGKELKKKFGFLKTGKQCRERWNNNLCPELNKEAWTAEEEKILFNLHKEHGNKWSVIAAELEGRTDNSTKNHFYSIVRKNLRKYNKTLPKDKRLTSSLQLLLVNPVYSKILLKRPRHFSRKTNSKGSSRKSSKKSSRRSSIMTSRRASKSSVGNPDPEQLKACLNNLKVAKPKATIRVRKSSSDSIQPLSLNNQEKGFRRSSLNHLEINTEVNSCLLSPMNLNSSCSNNPIFFDASRGNSMFLWGLDLRTPTENSFSICRNRNRDNSVKSSESSGFSRRESRNDTGESERPRNESRKNSQGGIVEEVVKDLIEASEVKNFFGFQYFPNIPNYSPTTRFEFNKTPKAGFWSKEKCDDSSFQ